MSTNTTDAGESSNRSTETFITALVLNAAVGGAEFAAFLLIRKYFPKIYSARSELVPEEEKDLRAKPLPSNGLFDVIPAIIRADDRTIITYNGLDAYLFVRFIKVLGLYVFAPIALLTWTILLPVYGTGSTGNTQLNQFTFGNIGRDQKARYAAPLILCYLSTFWILFIIHREWKSYIQLRREFLTSKRWRATPQANTVLITGVPSDQLNLEALHSFADPYPGGVAKIWLARDPEDLSDAYDRRQDAGKKLEKAGNKVIKAAVKLVKKNKVPAEGNGDQEKNGSKLSRYLPEKKRPTHRLGKVPCFGQKVDTLTYSAEEIEETNRLLQEGRNKGQDAYEAKAAAFIMFNDQVSAHEFAQNLNDNLPKKMKLSTRLINAAPDDVIWDNLNVKAADNKIRKIISWAITIVTIIFWAIPVAFVSSISNVSKLCSTVSWLSWLCTLPTPINGIIQGALPPIAFAILFMLLPIFLRKLSQFEGTPLHSLIERSLQKRYFAFLFIHGFIISTLASGIMAGISQITDDPSSAVSLLAENLPTSSVFFLTLIVTNGLAGAAGGILQIVRLAIYYVKAFLLGGSPRALYKVTYTMPAVRFGQLYPAQMLLVVIALAYSTIAPLVCGFALVTFTLWWFCYKYLFIWVHDQPASMETGGLFFKTALNQMFAGLYIEHLCLIGLFFLARDAGDGFAAIPEAALMIVLLISCVAAQIWLNWSTRKDNVYLPASMRSELGNQHIGNKDYKGATAQQNGGANDIEQGSYAAPGAPLDPTVSNNTTVVNQGRPSGDSGQMHLINSDGTGNSHHGGMLNKLSSTVHGDDKRGLKGSNFDTEPRSRDRSQDGERTGNPLLDRTMEDGTPMNYAYLNPAFYRDQPTLWLPRDNLGLSAEQVSKARSHGVDITDEDATMNEKAKIELQRDTLPGQDFDP
ncbi:DUF221-domain-containing protein [Cystobasidium minutum MCA 4210]|uniref:DUF221-domain-containing protein n=1 Tax=Cystobasidium minutum MCA 4210 TaxID=1397322 RepID=UPI0034CE157D|eukprot:jgi/Rhomi1/149705/estExt_Genewise1.C_2_t10382